MPVEHRDDALERVADPQAAGPGALEPALGHRQHLRPEALDDAQHEVMAIAEVDVERRPRQLGPAHHLVDGQIAERALTQQLLGCRR